uniref:Uncharacterized protein n=1 Tax=Arundo donax TaxID=35708 RepID=A0A0A8XZM7_ARUDO
MLHLLIFISDRYRVSNAPKLA